MTDVDVERWIGIAEYLAWKSFQGREAVKLTFSSGLTTALDSSQRQQETLLSTVGNARRTVSSRKTMPLNTKTTAPFEVGNCEDVAPRLHYQGVVYKILTTVWAGRFLIAAILVIALVFACAVLVLIGPRYTSQATIGLNFYRDEPATGAKTLPIASVDPVAMVDSAARMIRSRTTASAVVSRLGLDKDPDFARESLAWRVFSSLRSGLGFELVVPSDHDLAEERLVRLVTVTHDPRSYMISISVTGADPEWAAQLTNAVALEYLRGQLLQQVTEAYAAAEREVAETSSVYGVRHPAYQSGQMKLEDLRVRLQALREEPFDAAVASRVVGQSFVPAQEVMTPSSPPVLLILGFTTVAALAVGTWLALLPWPDKPPRTRRTLLPVWRNRLRRMRVAPAVSSNEPPRTAGLGVLSERTSVRGGDRRRPTNDSEGIDDMEVGVTERLRPGEPDAGPISQPGSG